MSKVDEFACLEVVSLQNVGAFLDVGRDKDLLLPFREQTRDLRVGDFVIVHVYLDNTGRECASMRTEKFIDETPGDYHQGDCVDLLISNRTDLGWRAIIDNRYFGVIYENEIFQPLHPGLRVHGFIKKMRPDGKIDLALLQAGHRDARHIGDKILEALEEADGFLPITDKSSAEQIYERFGVSKKKFKMGLGGLYKQRLVTLRADGIRLS